MVKISGLRFLIIKLILSVTVVTAGLNAYAIEQFSPYDCRLLILGRKPFSQPNIDTILAKESLTLLTYNIYNGRSANSSEQPEVEEAVASSFVKPLWAVYGVEDVIRRSDPDIAFLQEVQSPGHAVLFNREHLDEAFLVFTHPHQAKNEMANAIYVKRYLANFFDIEILAHERPRWFDPIKNEETHLFGREPVVLKFVSKQNRKWSFIVVNSHIKAKKSRKGDPGSRTIRSAQKKYMKEFLSRLKKQHKVPVVHAGDMNTPLHELAHDPLLSGFSDAFAVQQTQSYDEFERIEKIRDFSRLDYILVSEERASSVLRAGLIDYLDNAGRVVGRPSRHHDRTLNPSDHWANVVELSLVEFLTGNK